MSKFLDEQGLAVVSQQIFAKQDELVAGENIKTINGQSLMRSGDISALEVIVLNLQWNTPKKVSQQVINKLKNGTAVLVDYDGTYSVAYFLHSGSYSKYYFHALSTWSYSQQNAYNAYEQGNSYYIELNTSTRELTKKAFERKAISYVEKGFGLSVTNNTDHIITCGYMKALPYASSARYVEEIISPGSTASLSRVMEVYFNTTDEEIAVTSGTPIKTGVNRWGLVDSTNLAINPAPEGSGSDTPVGGTQLYSHDVTISGVLSGDPVSVRLVAITNVPSLDASQDWSLSILTNTLRLYNMMDDYSEDHVTFGFTAPATINQSMKNGQSATITFDEAPTITDTVTIL